MDSNEQPGLGSGKTNDNVDSGSEKEVTDNVVQLPV